MTQTAMIGWDIGGAHLKAVALQADGELLAIVQLPCPLWKGIDELHRAMTAVLQQLPAQPYRHAVTMTGELVDCFAGRDDGVAQILHAVEQILPPSPCFVFVGTRGLVATTAITAADYGAIASANWLASAQFAAQKLPCGLFVDMGSTTTDILLFDNGEVLAQGYSDYQRLVSQELVYIGIIRTAVMAVAQSVRDNGQEVGIMAEYFATMADVYRLTGELNEAHDQTDTADGAAKTVLASAKRLARMIGCDGAAQALPRWQQLAANIRTAQLHRIQHACQRHLARLPAADIPVMVGAGVGRFLLRELAKSLGLPYLDFSDLLPRTLPAGELAIADCAPALAVAALLINPKNTIEITA